MLGVRANARDFVGASMAASDCGTRELAAPFLIDGVSEQHAHGQGRWDIEIIFLRLLLWHVYDAWAWHPTPTSFAACLTHRLPALQMPPENPHDFLDRFRIVVQVFVGLLDEQLAFDTRDLGARDGDNAVGRLAAE